MSLVAWDSQTPGVMQLPSGRLIRGRSIRQAVEPRLQPEFGLYLLGKQPSPFDWDSQWLRWPDFWLPSDPGEASSAFRDALERSATERVEVACGGGRGRTGTALACIAVLDGVHAQDAVEYVRGHYDSHAVETPWQRRFVRRFTKSSHG